MTIRDSTQRSVTRPVAAGLLIALAGPLLGMCPLLVGAGLGLGLDAFAVFDVGILWIFLLAYFLMAAPSVIAGLLAALAIRRDGWVSPQHWRAVTAILTSSWIILLMMYVTIQPVSLGLIIIPYLIAMAIFASWALRLIIIRLRWMRRPLRLVA
jgi:hypothetical protein